MAVKKGMAAKAGARMQGVGALLNLKQAFTDAMRQQEWKMEYAKEQNKGAMERTQITQQGAAERALMGMYGVKQAGGKGVQELGTLPGAGAEGFETTKITAGPSGTTATLEPAGVQKFKDMRDIFNTASQDAARKVRLDSNLKFDEVMAEGVEYLMRQRNYAYGDLSKKNRDKLVSAAKKGKLSDNLIDRLTRGLKQGAAVAGAIGPTGAVAAKAYVAGLKALLERINKGDRGAYEELNEKVQNGEVTITENGDVYANQ